MKKKTVQEKNWLEKLFDKLNPYQVKPQQEIKKEKVVSSEYTNPTPGAHQDFEHE